MQSIVVDTLGKLRAHGRGLWGWCRGCAKLYRMSDPPQRRPLASFDIDMLALIAERGADYSIIRMAPVTCPRCGSRETEYRISTPPQG